MKSYFSFFKHPFAIIGTVSLMVVAYAITYACIHPAPTTFNAKEYAKTNHCPYEGLECPNAQEVYFRDSLQYADAEYVIDSLVDANARIQGQLDLYENKYGSVGGNIQTAEYKPHRY
jgi:hypothetical protein